MNATIKNKSRGSSRPNMERQIRHAKVVLRQLRDTLEDLEDRRELAPQKSAIPENLEFLGKRQKKNLALIFERGKMGRL